MKRVVVKVGSAVLTDNDEIALDRMMALVNFLAELRKTNEVILVSSGAVAAGYTELELDRAVIQNKQALASIGQPHLIRIFQENFRELGLLTSQCLLSYSDFEKKQSKKNIVNTINVLVKNNYIPIINENDTVATDEIKFGDNDKLAALTAVLLEVDLFLIATNTNGIYTKRSIGENKEETIVETADIQLLKNEVEKSISLHGTGGMSSKIEAAEIAQNANIETWILNGLNDNFMVDAIHNETCFTKITIK